MINPMQLMNMFRGGNPQQMVQQMMQNNPQMNNPVMRNAMQMAEKGDFQGVEQLARNLCKEKNIDVDKALEQLKTQFGMQ